MAAIAFQLLATDVPAQLRDSRWLKAVPSDRRAPLQARINELIQAERDCDWTRVYQLRLRSAPRDPAETSDDYVRWRTNHWAACAGVLESWDVIERLTDPEGRIQQFTGWAYYACSGARERHLTILMAELVDGQWYVELFLADTVRT